MNKKVGINLGKILYSRKVMRRKKNKMGYIKNNIDMSD